MNRDDLISALIKADAAGNVEDAKFLADQIRKMDAAASVGSSGAAAPGVPTAAPAKGVREQYDELPWYKKPVVAASDMARIFNDSVSFGLYDKLIGNILPGTDVEAQRRMTQDARERAGSAAIPADLMGAFAVGSGAGKLGLSAANYVNTAGMPFAKRLLGSAGAGAIDGAAFGAADAVGHDTDVREGMNSGAMLGGSFGALSQSAISTLGKILNRGANPVTPAPSFDDVSKAADNAYTEMQNAGVEYSPQAIADLNKLIENSLVKSPTGPRPVRHPATLAEVSALSKYTKYDPKNPGSLSPTSKGMSLYDLDQHRQAIRENVGLNPDGSERRQGTKLIGILDDFVNNATPFDVISGDPSAGAKAIAEARGLAHRKIKMSEVQSVLDKANRGEESLSGVSQGNQIRSKIKSMLDNDKKTVGYTDDEIAAMEGVVRGNKKSNTLRSLSTMAGNLPGYATGAAIGSGAGLVTGSPTVGAVGSTLGVIGASLAKRGLGSMAEKETRRQAEDLLDIVSRGGVKPNATPARTVDSKTVGELARILTLMSMNDHKGR